MAELPGVQGNIVDFGLSVSPEPTILNDSILIIGTASDGPMYEPIPVLGDKNAIQSVFGAFGQGTLVRGVFESIDATIEGTPDIRAMRIGNGKNAVLDIVERLSTDSPADEKTDGHTSLRLEAIYQGSKYNAVSIFIDEEKKINIYNPKTGVYSKITYDDTNPYNSAVNARNVSELVDVINSDPNIGSIVQASTSGIATQFEISVNANSSGITSDTAVTLDLATILSNYSNDPDNTDVFPTGYIFEADTSSTAGNLIDNLEEVFSISISEPVQLLTQGKTNIVTEFTPFDGKGDGRFDTIQALEDYNADDVYFHNPSGAVVSEYMSYLDKEVLPDVTTAEDTLDAFSATLGVYGWLAAPDDSFEVTITASGTLGPIQTVTDLSGNSGTSENAISGSLALAAVRASSGVYKSNGLISYPQADKIDSIDAELADYVYVTASGFADSFETSPGKIKIEVSDNGGVSDSDWAEVLYHPVSGIYVSDFTVASGKGTSTLKIGVDASGYTGDLSLITRGLITASGSVNPNKYLRMTCNTVKGFLSEAESLPNLQAASSNWLTYFFKGQELLFSDTVPFDTIVNYGVKINYEPGSDVVLTDATNGILKFVSTIQPGPAGDVLDSTNNSVIGLKYTHLPQFPAITTAAQSLADGADGTGINSKVLYDELDKAYTNLENYEVEIVVPMGANIDATKDDYNAITGLPEVVNAQFQYQLNTFLTRLSVNVNETISIMGTEQAESDKIADVKTWVDRLTVQNLSDPTRAANIMPLLNSKYISVTAFEPIFDNIGGLPYSANGAAAYAGMISSLFPHYSPTNKSIPNSLRSRFNLSNSQLEALSERRFVSMRKKPDRNPVITEAITAAVNGSDFTKLTTVRITFAAMDVVRSVCDPFIGQPNTQGKRNAMEGAITKGLSSMVEAGALRKYAFTVSSTSSQQVLGKIDIDLILVPIFEIKNIRTTVKLRTEIPSAT